MNKSKLTTTIFLSMLIFSIISTMTPKAFAQTEIYLDPSENSFTTDINPVGYRWNITAWVSDSPEVFAYQVRLVVDDSQLNITGAWLPSWDPEWIFTGMTTIKPIPSFSDINENGYPESVLVGDSLLFGDPASGSGKLAIIELEIIATPPEGEQLTSTLAINSIDTYILNYDLDELPVTKTDGSYTYSSGVIPPQPPITSFTYSPATPFVNETVTFDGTGSYDPDGEIVSYEWDFGDGNTGTGPVATHAYIEAGAYTVTLTVTDDQELSDLASETIEVTEIPPPQPPIASFTYSPPSPMVDETVTFDGTGSYDPDGEIVSYEWNFGDGNVGTGSTATHTYTMAGTYTVTLTVTDDDEQTDNAMETIEVIEVSPPPIDALEVILEPEYSKGHYPEWKNFTVKNSAMDKIVKVEMTHPDGYKPAEYHKPYGWKVNYNPMDRLIIFESTDPSMYYIPPCNEGVFKILFEKIPTEEGRYEFIVTVSDVGMLAYTLRLYQCIDKTPPKVEIIYPANQQKVIGEICINAKASDSGIYPAGIDRIELYLNGTYMGDMNYDPDNDIYSWCDITLWKDGAWYIATVIAYDKSHPEGNIGFDTVAFLWWEATEVNINPDNGYAPLTEVEVKGVGYKNGTWVDVYFGDIKVGEAYTNGLGRFTMTFTVPEAPRGPHEVNAFDDDNNHDLTPPEFTVIPYLTSLTPRFGTPCNYATIKGTGFKANTFVNIVFRDVHQGRIFWQWASEWNGTHTIEWHPHLDNLVVATVRSNDKGSITAEFHVPSSYGGIHPVYGQEDDRTRSANALFYHVTTKMWIEPTSGYSGQYITIYGEGLPLPWNYSMIMDGQTIYWQREWTLAIDFGPYKYWIWEENFILNNEFHLEWPMGLWQPFSYYGAMFMGSYPLLPPLPPEITPSWNGILVWRAIDMKYRIGSPYLKVPFLQPDEYTIEIYQYDRITQIDILEYAASDSFQLMSFCSGDLVEIIEKIDGLYLRIEDLEVKLDTINAKLVEIQGDLAILKTDIGTVKVKLDGLQAEFVDINGNVATINTTLGLILEELQSLDLNISLTNIGERIATIKSDIGTIEVDVSKIKADITSIEGSIVTISTSVGTIEKDIGDINAEIASVDENIITLQTNIGEFNVTIERISRIKDDLVQIETSIGNFDGKITKIDDDIATISTDVGEIKANTEKINGMANSVEQNANLMLYIWVLIVLVVLSMAASLGSLVISARRRKI